MWTLKRVQGDTTSAENCLNYTVFRRTHVKVIAENNKDHVFKINKTIFILASIGILPAFGIESSENLQKVIRFLNIFSRVPETAQLALVNKLNPTELLNVYEHLEPLEKRVQEIKDNKEHMNLYAKVVLAPFTDNNFTFKSKEVLEALAYNARQWVAKIFKCDTNEGDNALQNGTCKPLLNSHMQDLTSEQRNAQPFKKVVMTPDYWVQLLPVVDILNRWFYDSELWKIYFLQVIPIIKENSRNFISIHHKIVPVKKFFIRDQKKIFSAISPRIDSYNFYTNRGDLQGIGNCEYWEPYNKYDYFQHRINQEEEEKGTASPVNILKNEIKNLYMHMLPACIQDALLSGIIIDRHPSYSPDYSVYKDYIIYVEKLLDDPFVRKNIADFKKKIQHLTDHPKQVICPRSLTNIESKETRVINDETPIFWTA